MLTDEVGTVLAGLGCSPCTTAAGSGWHLGLHEARVHLQDNCLTFLSRPLPSASPWTTVQQNSGLGPGLRLVLDRNGQRRLAGETLLFSGDRLKIAERVRVLFDRFADSVSTIARNLQTDKTTGLVGTPSTSQDLRALAEELDRPVQENDSELLLDCGAGERAQKLRVRPDTTGLTASVPLLKSGSLSRESLDALSLLFLRVSSSCRFVRTAAAAADGVAFDFEVALVPLASAEEVDAALDCLVLSAGSCLDEAAVLQQADVAQAYLAMSSGGMVNPDQKGGESHG